MAKSTFAGSQSRQSEREREDAALRRAGLGARNQKTDRNGTSDKNAGVSRGAGGKPPPKRSNKM